MSSTHSEDGMIMFRSNNLKGVLCFNGPVRKDIHGNFYSNLLSEEFLDKYLQICDSLIVATRIRKDNTDLSECGQHIVDDKRISFVECPDYTTPKQVITNKKRLYNALEQALSNANILFVRVSGSIAVEAAKLASKKGIPCLVEVVTCAKDVYWNHSTKGKIAMPYMYHQMKKIVRNADYVQYITERFMQSRYPTNGRSFVCSNALIEPLSEDLLQERLSKYREPLKNRTIHLATTGTYSVAYKGQADVIKALPILRAKGYSIIYHLIGDGDRDRILDIAKACGVEDAVDLVGSLKHNEVHTFLDDMDLYIQPSWAEAQGRSLIEALSRGLPCACSNVGGMVELVESDYIFKKKNPKSIAEILERMLKADLAKVAERNHQKSLEFEKNKLIEKRRAIFSEVAASRK